MPSDVISLFKIKSYNIAPKQMKRAITPAFAIISKAVFCSRSSTEVPLPNGITRFRGIA